MPYAIITVIRKYNSISNFHHRLLISVQIYAQLRIQKDSGLLLYCGVFIVGKKNVLTTTYADHAEKIYLILCGSAKHFI